MYWSKIYGLYRNGGFDMSSIYILYLANYFRLIDRLDRLTKDDERVQEVVADLRDLTRLLGEQLRDEYSHGQTVTAEGS